jgi:hypothetical protein
MFGAVLSTNSGRSCCLVMSWPAMYGYTNGYTWPKESEPYGETVDATRHAICHLSGGQLTRPVQPSKLGEDCGVEMPGACTAEACGCASIDPA